MTGGSGASDGVHHANRSLTPCSAVGRCCAGADADSDGFCRSLGDSGQAVLGADSRLASSMSTRKRMLALAHRPPDFCAKPDS